MNRKLAVCLILITLLPLAVISWLGASRIMGQQDQLRRQGEILLKNNLDNAGQRIQNILLQIESSLIQLLPTGEPPFAELASISRRSPLVTQAFFLSRSGTLLYPDSNLALSTGERDFLTRTRLLWNDNAVLQGNTVPENQKRRLVQSSGRMKKTPHSLLSLALEQPHGWIPWYWEDGLHLLFWKSTAEGTVTGAEVNGITLISRITASLPEGDEMTGRYVLTDARGVSVYEWGRESEDTGTPLVQSISLPSPLHAWQIRFYGSEMPSTEGDIRNQVLMQATVFILLILTMIGLSVYFFRESSRSFREAEHQVQFVNRVSHELKTPLTNIRLYAELLEDKLSEDETSAGKQLQVIQTETERLTRLISNILTFSKQDKTGPKIKPTPVCVDDIIRQILKAFKPSLEQLGIQIELDLQASANVALDADAGGQVIYNLLSNVEKYGRSGKYLGITSRQKGGLTYITVADKGPGIPRAHLRKIFTPYYRVSSSVTEGISGTGIGLSISRELARLHGGDLVLSESRYGCTFKWIIPSRGQTA